MKLRKSLASLCFLLFAFLFSMAASAAGNLEVCFLDVGQGLSVLLSCDGHYALYDGGDRDYSSRVVAHLQEQGVDSLDYVIASHYDADHLNGVVGALNVFPAGQIWGPKDDSKDTRVYEAFVEAANAQGKEIIQPQIGSTFPLGGAQLTVLGPCSENYADSNSYSIVVKVENGEDSFLLTGDAPMECEEEMLSAGEDLSCDVLCAGHHGSATSTSWDLLEAALPSWCVISCGTGNDYSHPHEETMEKLASMEIPVFRTDIQGDLVAFSAGSGITWNIDPCNDYSSGDESPKAALDASESVSATESPAPSEDAVSYVVNTNSGKFHLPSCSSVDQMSSKNRLDFTGTREELIAQGYEPCKRCSP